MVWCMGIVVRARQALISSSNCNLYPLQLHCCIKNLKQEPNKQSSPPLKVRQSQNCMYRGEGVAQIHVQEGQSH